MEKGNVTVDAIVCDRRCRATDAEIKALAEDIRDKGLKHPVLVVKGGNVLIDGLSRVKAYQLLGWSVVPALFTADPSEAADELEKLRHGKTLSYERGMEIFYDLKILGKMRSIQRRTGIPRHTKMPPVESVRTAAWRATGVNENATNRISVLMNLAKAGEPEAIDIVAGIFASEPGSRIIGFSRATELNRSRNMLEMDLPERIQALFDILRATEKSLEQMRRVGGFELLTHEDAEPVIARLSSISRVATSIRNEIRRSTK